MPDTGEYWLYSTEAFLTSQGFTNVPASGFMTWSSTTRVYGAETNMAWFIYMGGAINSGSVYGWNIDWSDKSSLYYAWPVRTGP